MKILAATNNKHKIEEFRNILQDTDARIISSDELGRELPDIIEDGATFEENAAIKALGFAKFADMTVIADDSGLEIKALDGAPGVYSARYAETGEKRIERVLKELGKANSENQSKTGNCKSEGIGARPATDDRSARFVCVIALAEPGKVIETFRGEVYGVIGFEPRGGGGFGYDPIFIPDGYDRTFAELGADIKDKISHRANALKKLDEYLKKSHYAG